MASTSKSSSDRLAEAHVRVTAVVKKRGLRHFEQPVRLASGELSHDFVDGKAALAHGDDLAIACQAILLELEAAGIDFDAVGGLTMGADQFAHALALLASREWFVVRKEPKNRGTKQLIEGAQIGRTTRALLVDDVVTTGGSIQRAFDAITDAGATVVAAVTLVDRGEVACRFFEERDVPYFRLVTYSDLEIPPVGGGLVSV
jgi:orotate phosphoribosyltransferase